MVSQYLLVFLFIYFCLLYILFMQTSTLTFPYSARTTYTAVKNLFRKQDKFSSVRCDDNLFVVEARHGAWISPFSENIKVKVVATGCDSCKVVVESSSRSMLNLLNFGANSDNVSDLGDYISNEAYRLQNVDTLVRKSEDHSVIRFKTPDIKFK